MNNLFDYDLTDAIQEQGEFLSLPGLNGTPRPGARGTLQKAKTGMAIRRAKLNVLNND